jgi:Ser-tRNA(Ala) deacylase AlaX
VRGPATDCLYLRDDRCVEVLHVLNTIALRDYGGWITGVQIGVDYSRIDFKLDDLGATTRVELERKSEYRARRPSRAEGVLHLGG